MEEERKTGREEKCFPVVEVEGEGRQMGGSVTESGTDRIIACEVRKVRGGTEADDGGTEERLWWWIWNRLAL